MYYDEQLIQNLNKDIELFPQVHPITDDMKRTFDGISRLVMIDRYSFKDLEKKTLKVGDFVVLTAKPDPKYPTRALGIVVDIDWENRKASVKLEEQYHNVLEGEEAETGVVTRNFEVIEKPLELFYEQIAKRNATGLASVEKTPEERQRAFEEFYDVLVENDLVPAGRVLNGAGSDTNVTYFNCYVMPFIHDSRGGIADHRKAVMEIMSRGGGVGTNGSTLRPNGALTKGVNGKASGSVSWLDDLAKLTHLVEQGGSRRGAQMIMLADWHPDIIEFIISKIQNPAVLRHLMNNAKDEQIREHAKNKLKFTPFTQAEIDLYKDYTEICERLGATNNEKYKVAKKKLEDGGLYQVNNPEFLTGANISVLLSREFMDAVENDGYYELRFPDTENYNEEEMRIYNEEWHKVGDVREWEAMGHRVKVYRRIRARELWDLINICATYSAEPGIFFIDNANDMTNAKAYGQKVVATNPCGKSA